MKYVIFSPLKKYLFFGRYLMMPPGVLTPALGTTALMIYMGVSVICAHYLINIKAY